MNHNAFLFCTIPQSFINAVNVLFDFYGFTARLEENLESNLGKWFYNFVRLCGVIGAIA